MAPVVQMGHHAALTCAAFSTDGQYLLSGGDDGSIKLWEVATGREIRTLDTGAIISDVAFSPDNKTALAGSGDGSLVLWEVTTGRLRHYPKVHQTAVKRVAFSPHGFFTVSGDGNLKVVVMDVATGKRVRSFNGTKAYLFNYAPSAVAFSNDCRLALLGSNNNQLWNAETGRKIYTLGTYTPMMRWGNPIVDVAFSPDGRFFVSAGRVMDLIETASGRTVRSFSDIPSGLRSVAFSPDGRHLAAATNQGLALWAVTSGRRLGTYAHQTGKIHRAVWSPDNRFILTANLDGNLYLLDSATKRKVRDFKGRSEKVMATAGSTDGRFILTGTQTGALVLWDLQKGIGARRFKSHMEEVLCLAITPDGRYALSGGADHLIKYWDIHEGKVMRTFAGHTAEVTSLSVSPDGRTAISGSRDHTNILWDLQTGRSVRQFKGHTHWVNAVSLSPDGRTILSAGSDSTWRLWDLTTGREIRSNTDSAGWIHSTAFSPEGRFIYTGSWKTVTMWDTSSGEKVASFNNHLGNVTSIAVSPDGRLVLSGDDKGGLRSWESGTRKARTGFDGHLGAVQAVAFSPDARMAHSAGEDGTTRIWSVATGEEIARMVSSKDGEWLIVTPDGYYTTSPEGGGLLHWVAERGLETFTYEQFQSKFNRPLVIKERLAGESGAGRPVPEATLPPTVVLPNHQTVAKVADTVFPLTVSAVSHQRLTAIRIFANGKPAKEILLSAKKARQSLQVPLFSGFNRITAVAWDENGFSSNSKYMDVICDRPSLPKTNLYVLSVGISDYPHLAPEWALKFAHTDARSVAEVLKGQKELVFDRVETNLAVNQNATVGGITSALNSLSSIGENDIALIFMAGHGVRDENGTFYFLTSDATSGDPGSGGINWDLIGEYLSRIKGRVILLLDACHSGSIVQETIVPNDELAGAFFAGKRNGVMVFSASKGRQYSFESPDIEGGFGIFTYALTQALTKRSDEVDTDDNGYVEFMELVDYVRQYVDDETQGAQTPWLSRKELFGDLPIAVVQKEGVDRLVGAALPN